MFGVVEVVLEPRKPRVSVTAVSGAVGGRNFMGLYIFEVNVGFGVAGCCLGRVYLNLIYHKRIVRANV